MTFRVNRSKQLIPLAVIERSGALEKRLAPLGVKLEWLEFAAGPQQIEAVNAGALDLALTAESPPIFALAADGPVVFLAATRANGKLVSLLVSGRSGIGALSDIKGKKIAVQKASIGHYLLLRALDSLHLRPSDVETVYLPPPDANAAFSQGTVDGWFIWEPFVTRTVLSGSGRVLVDGSELRDTTNFYTTSRSFAREHAEVLKAFFDELQKAEAWSASHPKEMVELLAPTLLIDPQTLLIMHQKTDFGVVPVSDAAVEKLQQVADMWFSLQFLPKRVTVKDGLLSPAEYRAVLPQGVLEAH